jgi:hypothetical protein
MQTGSTKEAATEFKAGVVWRFVSPAATLPQGSPIPNAEVWKQSVDQYKLSRLREM